MWRRTMRSVVLAAACVLVQLVGLVASAEEVAVLTIQEQAGAARVNEPIRMGIPLAKGVAKDVSELALLDANGQPLPCQFSQVMRHLDDKSLRWVCAVFQASVGAKGKTTVTLVKGKATQSPRMNVTEADGKVSLDNGVLKLVVATPGVIESASFKGVEVVKPHKEGLVAVIDGKTHRPSADSKVTVEEKGSEGAVVKIEGRLVDEAGQGPFAYVCYVHAYQASPVVRVEFAYTNAQGKVAGDLVKLSDLSLVLPTVLADSSGSVGGEDKVYSGKSAKIAATGSDQCEIRVDDQAAGVAKGKSTKPLAIGWAAVGSGNVGLAGGLRWFWQMYPRAMEASAGKLRAGFYAAEGGSPLDVYMGQGRTHYLTLLFTDGKADNLASFFAGTQMPLRAVCTPKYYCRDTQVFGPIADADPAVYPADVLEREKKFNGYFGASVATINKKIDNMTYNGVTLDSYGYMAWGDLFHHANTPGVKDPWNILWESNYYDYPWTVFLQFARTGDLGYLDICDRNGLHLADVFMCKWHPQKELCGACRYSPPANHVGGDVDYQTPKPYLSVEFNHHKSQSILARYLMFGDLRARDDFMLALNNATLNPEASWRQCRGPGAKLATLYEGYLLTGDPMVLDKMKTCVAGSKRFKASPAGFCENRSGGYFMMGIAAEGLVRYWWLTHDKNAFETFQAMCDLLVPECGKKDSKYITTNLTLALSVLYRETGEEKYKEAALNLFDQCVPETRPKNTGQQWRNAAYAWYYLSNLGEKKKAE